MFFFFNSNSQLGYQARKKIKLNSSLPFRPAALKLLLADDKPGPLSIEWVKLQSNLSGRKIYLSYSPFLEPWDNDCDITHKIFIAISNMLPDYNIVRAVKIDSLQDEGNINYEVK